MKTAIVQVGIPPRRLYHYAEVMQLLGVSKSQLRIMIVRGELHAKKMGKFTMIPAQSLERFIENLPEAS